MLIRKETVMDYEVKSVGNELFNCEALLKEVPVSASKNFEVNDYVMHFYGLERYHLWHCQLENIND